MSPPRDPVRTSVAVVALALACFAGGWWMGKADAALERQEARIAALERGAVLAQADAVQAARARPHAGRATSPAPSPPKAPAAPVEVDVEDAPARGPADAPVTLVAFEDFECPFCAQVAPTLERLADEYDGRVRVVFKHFPLPMHTRAIEAHKAAEAAARQGALWPMHDRIFAAPEALDPASLRAHAEALGLDLAAYDAALASPELEARIRADVAEGQRIGVRGTPSFVVNGRLFSGALPYEAMKAHLDQALAEASAPSVAAAPAGAGR